MSTRHAVYEKPIHPLHDQYNKVAMNHNIVTNHQFHPLELSYFVSGRGEGWTAYRTPLIRTLMGQNKCPDQGGVHISGVERWYFKEEESVNYFRGVLIEGFHCTPFL